MYWLFRRATLRLCWGPQPTWQHIRDGYLCTCYLRTKACAPCICVCHSVHTSVRHRRQTIYRLCKGPLLSCEYTRNEGFMCTSYVYAYLCIRMSLNSYLGPTFISQLKAMLKSSIILQHIGHVFEVCVACVHMILHVRASMLIWLKNCVWLIQLQ